MLERKSSEEQIRTLMHDVCTLTIVVKKLEERIHALEAENEKRERERRGVYKEPQSRTPQ